MLPQDIGQCLAHLGFLQDPEDLLLGVMFFHVGSSLFSPDFLAHATPVSGEQVKVQTDPCPMTFHHNTGPERSGGRKQTA